jgi:transposase-like protein
MIIEKCPNCNREMLREYPVGTTLPPSDRYYCRSCNIQKDVYVGIR